MFKQLFSISGGIVLIVLGMFFSTISYNATEYYGTVHAFSYGCLVQPLDFQGIYDSTFDSDICIHNYSLAIVVSIITFVGSLAIVYPVKKSLMSPNKKITSLAIFAILTIAIGVITGTNFQDESIGVQTNPIEFTNENYYPILVTYITTDVEEIASLSDNIIKGKIVNVSSDAVPVTDTEENVPIPFIDRKIYTIKVSENIKGHKNTIDVVTTIPSKIDYRVGDKVLVMANSFDGEYMLIGGPHSMYKLKEGKAIGDKLTFGEKTLSDAIKNTEDRSKELSKSKGK